MSERNFPKTGLSSAARPHATTPALRSVRSPKAIGWDWRDKPAKIVYQCGDHFHPDPDGTVKLTHNGLKVGGTKLVTF